MDQCQLSTYFRSILFANWTHKTSVIHKTNKQIPSALKQDSWPHGLLVLITDRLEQLTPDNNTWLTKSHVYIHSCLLCE